MRLRRFIQVSAALIANPWFLYFRTRKLYQGIGKGFCFPGLNCYACPLAISSCPIGALQNSLAKVSPKSNLSIGKGLLSFVYVAGIISIIGFLAGRLICGWICPFGLFQDILYKIPFRKLRLPKQLRSLKYVVLITLVLALPFITGVHWFSRLCPAGTLEGALPLIIVRPAGGLPRIGPFFWMKIGIMVFFIVWMASTSRPFCRTICPLGAIMGLFNRVSLYRISLDRVACIDCGRCVEVCPVGIDVTEDPNSPECIRCLECKRACTQNAIRSGILLSRR